MQRRKQGLRDESNKKEVREESKEQCPQVNLILSEPGMW